MDTAPSLKKEIRIFSRIMNDDYISYIKAAFEQEIEIAKSTIGKLHHLFVEEEGLSDSWAEMICSGLYGAIMYAKGIGTTRVVRAEVDDFIIPSSTEKQIPISPERDIEVAFKTRYNNQISANNVKDPNCSNDYDVFLQYKCQVCGYVAGGYSLKYKRYGKCPICKSKMWKETTEKSQDGPIIPTELSRSSKAYNESTSNSIYNKGMVDESMKLYNEALEKYRQAANGGYIPAFTDVGRIYIKKGNYKKAWKWYLKAAEAGDSEGEYYVGYFYQEGKHVKRNTTFAINYYEKAAKKGFSKALTAIANCYDCGIGYHKDKDKAMVYYKLAAEKGDAEAQCILGLHLQNGDGCEKDVVAAADWFWKASTQGSEYAKKKLDECISKMTLDQRIKWGSH